MTTSIPDTVADVSREWLAEVTGFDIETLVIEQIGVGVGLTSSVYRARLTGGVVRRV